MCSRLKSRKLRLLGAALALGFLPVFIIPSVALAGSFGPGREPVYVDSVDPSGNAVLTNAAIVISFTAPMSPASVFISVSPSVSYEVSWLDDNTTVRLQPIGLLHSTTYEVQVRGRSSIGGWLRGQHVFQFTTAAGAPVAIAPGPAVIRVPMLLYHYVRVNPVANDYMGYRLSVAPVDFAAQMDWLARNGYHPITLRELFAFLSGQGGLPSKPIVLTFDDGYADFYTSALSILRSHDFTAVSFVVSGFMGRSGYMSREQVKAAENAGFEIASHTVDHVSLVKQSNDGLRYQVTESKRMLEELLGRPVTSFAYPYGTFGQREVTAVSAAGYEDATVTSYSGAFRSMSNRFIWSRIRVFGGENIAQFAYSINTA